jgi:hypothetical protein
MKFKTMFSYALAICSLTLVINSAAFSASVFQAKDDKPKLTAEEAKAAKAVESAADVNAKLVAAEDFVKKYPKSSARPTVAEYMVSQILDITDPDQKLAAAQKYSSFFNEPGEAAGIKPAQLDAFTKLKRFDDAFSEGAKYLEKNPDDIQVLILLAVSGVEQAKQGNPKFVTDSQKYGTKAIALLEADKKPTTMDDAVWAAQKANLPQVYTEMAIVSFMQQKPAEAQAKLEKATTLSPKDPFNYMLLGTITNDEYQKMAQTYKGMPDGKAKDDLLQRINASLDKVIDYYARAVALSEGKEQYQKFHDQLLQDLTSYYKYRHSSSTDGMQKLIDSYKLP